MMAVVMGHRWRLKKGGAGAGSLGLLPIGHGIDAAAMICTMVDASLLEAVLMCNYCDGGESKVFLHGQM